MRRVTTAVVASLALTACGSGNHSYIPPGTYAGSTATDLPVTLDVGDKIHVNKLEGKLVKRDVIEVKHRGVHFLVTCKVADKKGEELRCTFSFPKTDAAPATSEVIDLMLL